MQAILDFLTHLPKEYLFAIVLIGVIIFSSMWNRIAIPERFLRLGTSLFPNNAQAHYNLGMVLSKKSENLLIEDAEKELRQAIAINPMLRDAYYTLASVLTGKPSGISEAENLCSEMLIRFPHDSMTYNLLGYLCQKRGSLLEAEQAYQKAISLSPRLLNAYDDLMGLLITQKRFLEAEQVYRQGGDAVPFGDMEKHYMFVAITLDGSGKYTEALAAFKKVLQLNPKNENALLYIGCLLQDSLNRPKEAESFYRKAIKNNSKNPYIYFQLGLLLFQHDRRYVEAETLFLKTLELKPQEADALYNLSCIKSILGDDESALKYLREAIQNGFDRTWAWNDSDLERLKCDRRFAEIVGIQPEKV